MAGIRRSGVLAMLHLIRVHTKVHQHSTEHLKCFNNLTPAQFDVISHLSVAPGITQQDLSERLLVTKGNTCGLLDRLEALGLVERQDDPEDRRAHRLYLTEAGNQLAEKVIPAQEEF